jgi:competence protein ComEA
MAGVGAVATDEQFASILDYLAKNLAPQTTAKVNVNAAAAAELVGGLGLTQKDAEAIVSYRAKNGNFKSLDELKKVPGIDLQKLDASASLVTF